MQNTLITRRNVLLSASTVGVVAGLGIWHAHSGDISEVGMEADRAYKLAQAGEITLIDIRRPDEWEATGIPKGAAPLDMRRDDFITELSKLTANSPDKPVVLICAGGVRSNRMRNALLEAGMTRIQDIPEGMHGSAAGPGWLARKLPLDEVQ
jgi:rhodanese-related sulfurtransferase